MTAAEDEPFGYDVARLRGSFCFGVEGMRAKAFDAAGSALDDLDLDDLDSADLDLADLDFGDWDLTDLTGLLLLTDARLFVPGIRFLVFDADGDAGAAGLVAAPGLAATDGLVAEAGLAAATGALPILPATQA